MEHNLTKPQRKIVKRMQDGWSLRVDSMGAYFKRGFDRILDIPLSPIMDLLHKGVIVDISSPTANCEIYELTKQTAPAPEPGKSC